MALRGLSAWLFATCVACGSGSAATTATVTSDAAGSAIDPAADASDAVAEVSVSGDASPLPIGPLALAPGEVAEVEVGEAGAVAQLATPDGTEQFVAVLVSTQFAKSAKTYAYDVALDDSLAATAAALRTTCALSSHAGQGQGQAVAAEPPPAGKPPQVGDKRVLHMGATDIQATVTAVGTWGVVWVDDTSTIDAAVTAEFLKDFDNLILPRGRSVFGIESDLDGDGHIGLVFSPVTYASAVAYFTPCDLQASDGCGAGNAGEFLYLTPPSVIAPPYNTPAAIKETLAHELGHLIHFHRKVLRNQLSAWLDSSYLIEGVGGFTQDVSGFQSGNLYVAMAGLDGINDFSLGSVLVDATKYDPKKDGLLRGGSYWFVRWLYDRAGGDQALGDGTLADQGGPALMRQLLDAPVTVAQALPTAASATLADLALDFYTALAASNREDKQQAQALNPCFRFAPVVSDPVTKKPRGGNVYAKFHGTQMKGPATQKLAKADKKLRGGGVEYLLVEANPNSTTLPFVAVAEPEAQLRVRILRVR
jgi:hypothetical protein